MAIELIGKLIQLLPPQSGTSQRGNWSKQEFVIETSEQYPKKICISAWNDNASKVAQIPVGTAIKAAVNIESREYNGKWYTDVRMWNVEVEQASVMDPVYPDTQYSDMPPMDSAPSIPSAPLSAYGPEEGDDLPF